MKAAQYDACQDVFKIIYAFSLIDVVRRAECNLDTDDVAARRIIIRDSRRREASFTTVDNGVGFSKRVPRSRRRDAIRCNWISSDDIRYHPMISTNEPMEHRVDGGQ